MEPVDCFVIRHAESEREPYVPQDEWPLSVVGQEQAKVLSAQMRDRGIERIYSSPYPCAVATVKPPL